jgi:hypothetical protein
MANQQLAIVYAALFARITHRTLVLPELLLDGTQLSGEQVTASSTTAVPFHHFYSPDALEEALSKVRVEAVPDRSAPPLSAYTNFTFEQPAAKQWPLRTLQQQTADAAHVAMDCPLFKLPAWEQDMWQHTDLVWAVLDGLQPAPALAAEIHSAKTALCGMAATGSYSVLHLRLEEDWQAHCRRCVCRLQMKANAPVCMLRYASMPAAGKPSMTSLCETTATTTRSALMSFCKWAAVLLPPLYTNPATATCTPAARANA